jgi:alkylation response protein AidB-like acyl-CoA dehydrogenase
MTAPAAGNVPRLRDVIAFELADGASEIRKLIIARRMFGRGVAG